MPPQPRLLILDCDGVLVRSERANLAYYNRLFSAFHMPVVDAGDRERFWLLHTLSTPQVIDAFFPETLRERARQAAGELEFSDFLSEIDPEPGWPGVLSRLRATTHLAVATNRGASAREVLAAAGVLSHLDFVATIRDVARPKPHPDLLLAVLDHFGASGTDALYVGDSELDRRASAAAGIPFMGFRTPLPPSVTTPEELEAWFAEVARRPDSVNLPSSLPLPLIDEGGRS